MISGTTFSPRFMLQAFAQDAINTTKWRYSRDQKMQQANMQVFRMNLKGSLGL